jgi:[protein-PII] uridylyltransferase
MSPAVAELAVEADHTPLFDAAALATTLATQPQQVLSVLKQAVRDFNAGLKQRYQQGAPVESIVHGRAQIIDRVLNRLYQHFFASADQPLCLIAVGGYGRGELHPASDIDLMILLQSTETQTTRDAIERFLMLLWDCRLEIGHSVRTLDECVSEATRDITVATNIMEARLLAGDNDLFAHMKQRTGPEHIWDDRAFFEAKLEEQILRNGKYNDTAYNLEPNIKESAGGLRDIQMIGWVAKRHFGADQLQELVAHHFLRQYELDTLQQGQQLLWRIRCSLHYLTGRREDRLLFDYQRDLAIEFGFADDPNGEHSNLAIEQFMQQYYRTVMELERLNEMLLQLFREAIIYKDQPGEAVIINDSFQVRHGYLEVRHNDVFKKTPTAILELFLLMEQHSEIQGVRAETIRLLREHRYLITEQFRTCGEANSLFMTIMRQSRGVTHELRRMNRYGILAAYIPAFDAIVGRMQYDLFHAYTVDQHTLFVVRNLRRFASSEFCHEFPLASGIFHHLKKPELLYIAGLFHDIAKGRGGDHSDLGAVDARNFCINHGLKDDETALVSWLVQHHLIMSMTAQRKDISDADVIAEFGTLMNTLENLDYLYLLTLADIRGTNPKHWNSWKDKLLIELYHSTAQYLHRGRSGASDKQENLYRNKTAALRLLDQGGISTQRTHELWQHFGDAYFLRHTSRQIAWHTQTIYEHAKPGEALVEARVDRATGSIEILIYTRTEDEVFAMVVDVISKLDLNIADAHVMLGNNDTMLLTFRIVFNKDNEEHLKHYALELEMKIQQRLANQEDLPLDNNVWSKPRVHRHFNVANNISFENDDARPTTRLHITTADRPGLLAMIARVFVACGIRIHNARVSTAGEKATDYFDITNRVNDTRLGAEEQNLLKQSLLEQL